MAGTTKTEQAPRVTTPWGPARVVDSVAVQQRAGDKRFATVAELLETTKGEQLVRIAYSTGGVVRRGPVTMRSRDLDRLRAALAEHGEIASALGLGGA